MKKRIKKDIDLRCASSIDEMIKMCDECKFHACEGCEHTWTIVQEIMRKLKKIRRKLVLI